MLNRLKSSVPALFKHELVRLLPLIGLAALLLFDRTESNVVFFNMGIIFAVLAISHIMRKLLFPYIDLEEYAKSAMQAPLPASIVFLSVCYILSIIIQSSLRLIS